MNSQEFLKHIAEVTGRNLEEISKELKPEYWKDMCSFGSFKGKDIFYDYVSKKRINRFQPYPGGFRVGIPELDFNLNASEFQRINLYIVGTYARIFKRERPEFKYPDF